MHDTHTKCPPQNWLAADSLSHAENTSATWDITQRPPVRVNISERRTAVLPN